MSPAFAAECGALQTISSVALESSTDHLREHVPVKINGTPLVRPDGTIGLGPFGSVHVSGLTIEQARAMKLELEAPQRMAIGDSAAAKVP